MTSVKKVPCKKQTGKKDKEYQVFPVWGKECNRKNSGQGKNDTLKKKGPGPPMKMSGKEKVARPRRRKGSS